MLFSKVFTFTLCGVHLVSAIKQPNILFILTDDQDWHMQSLAHMPLVQKYLINEGTLYSRHFCTVALCCPSRVNLWTGRAAHNTNVTDVWPPYGGYPKIVREGINEDYIFTWMQDAGYNTYYSGKLWNAHSVENYNAPYAGGFTASDFVLDPYTYQYLNASMSRNGGKPVSYAGQYSPDVTAQKAYDFMDEAMGQDKPWFLVHAPIAPHGDIRLEEEFVADMPRYASRHAHLFKDYKIPRDENFNPEAPSGVSWISQLPQLNDTVVAYNDEYQRARLRALQSVDESVERMVKKLEAAGQLDNTYIIYTTDNGYHISQHRMHPGKECGFDTDVHIPMIIRGPGVPAGHMSEAVTSHTDVVPTISKLAGLPAKDFDGTPIPLNRIEEESAKQEHVTIEYWGLVIPEGLWGWYGDHDMNDDYGAPGRGIGNNTYKAIRVIGQQYNLYYAVWCTGETEFYDMTDDPGQMRNLFSERFSTLRAEFSVAGRPFKETVARLDALMMVLKSCKGRSCTNPWETLHPKGNVGSLSDSLKSRFDTFYNDQPKVQFTSCELYYNKDAEGPMNVVPYGGMPLHEWKSELRKKGVPISFRYQGDFSIWT